MIKKAVDLIIFTRWLLPIVPANHLQERQAVVIADGLIIDICNQVQAVTSYQAIELIELDEHVLMPGLVNAHTHAAMSLMRGIADDIPLMPWLKEHIWPAEQKLVSSQFVYDGTLLACAEMLSGGVTSYNDMYFFPEAAARASQKIGMRANLGLVVLEFPTNYAIDAENYIQKGLQTRDDFKNEPLIRFNFAPHAPYTVEDATFSRIAMLAEQVDMSIHSHMHETLQEIEQSEQTYGIRPLQRLANLGLLGPNLSLAHGVHLNTTEVRLLAEYGCHIVHCPSSNLKLASGIAPITSYLHNGINVALGTDGAASNNRLDLFAEMRLAALLAKGESGDATTVSAYQALEMATINGAKALNMEDQIGSIEIGKQADLVAVRLSAIEMQPCFDVASHLVYVAGREQVSHVWVSGQLKYCQLSQGRGSFAGVEPHELGAIVTKWQPKLSEFK